MIDQATFTIHGTSQRPILMDLTSDGKDDKTPLVLFAHGFKGFKDWGAYNLVASYFAEMGFRFLKFNFSHNGTTPQNPDEFKDLGAFGNNTFTQELSDLDQVITYACSGKDFFPANTIYLIGHSRGGGICIIQAREDKRIKKLITWASVSRFKSLWMAEQEDQWRRNKIIYIDNARTHQKMPLKIDLLYDLEINSDRLNLLTAASQLKKPWLIIHGEHDQTVPEEQAYELDSQRKQGNLLSIKGADHVFGAKHPWYQEHLPVKLKEVCDASIGFLKN